MKNILYREFFTQNHTLLKQVFRIMKLQFIFLFMCCVAMHASKAYSQEARVTIIATNSSVKDVLQEIEEKAGCFFLYNQEEVDLNRKTSVNAKEKSVLEILSHIFKNTDTKFVVEGNNIVLMKNDVVQQKARTVSGTIVDERGEPIIGANVVEKGTTNGVVTDIEGHFSLSVANDAVLQVTYIGYLAQNIAVKNQNSLSIVLKEDSQSLDEIVVVGYGTRQKATLTGSVVAIKGEEIVKSPSVNIAQSLAGRLPGVVINSRSGEPGGDDPSVSIRGRGSIDKNDVLYVIDGVERIGLGRMNPNDIESISVLKDAEAAIYGSRAANGVIVITTKRGKEGKPAVNVSFSQGYSQPTRNPRMADSYTFASIANELITLNHQNPGTAPVLKYTAEELEKFRTGSDPNYPNTDWYGFIVRDLTPQHRTSVSISGANERTSYYLSLGEMYQDGQYNQGSLNYKHYNFRSNIDVKVSDNLKIGMNLSGKIESKHAPITSSYELSSHTFLYFPTQQPYWPGTDLMQPLRDNENILNWVTDNAGSNDTDSKSFESTFFFKWNLPWVKGLSVEGRGSFDAAQIFRKTFATPTTVYFKNGETGKLEERQSGRSVNKAALTDYTLLQESLVLSGRINYARSFGNHNLDILAGYEQLQSNGHELKASRSDYASTALPELNVGSVEKEKQSNEGKSNKNARQSYYFRSNYDYKGRYLAQVTFRVDGSSNFPKEERFGYFPSMSAGWRISEEAFMENLDFLNNLKVRGSWGMMGNDNTDQFQYMMTYNYGLNYVVGANEVQGLYETRVPNPNITWETSKTWNAGFEATLWNGLLSMEFDYFNSKRADILWTRNVTVPSYTGIALPRENIGKVRNQGFELALTHHNKIGNVQYMVSGNVAFARNKVLYIDEAPAAEPYQYSTGRPVGSSLYYKAIGIFKDDAQLKGYPHLAESGVGDIMFEDVNKDNVLDSKDMIRENLTNLPEVTFGLNMSFQYKDFDLALLFQGQESAKQYMGGSGFLASMDDTFGNFLEWRAQDRWMPGADNTNAKMPRARTGFTNVNTNSNTLWLFNAGFLRMKNIELGYNLPALACQKIGIANVRFSVSGSNLFLIYDHMGKQGLDPEADNYWYYPLQRTYNVGINLTF